MKLVSREVLKTMPEGTIFQSYQPHYMGDLCILSGCGLPDGPDFVQAEL